MPERLEYLEIRQPSDCNGIRKLVERNRALDIEGYERFVKQDPEGKVPDRLNFMLGYQDENGKAHYVAGVTTVIFEFSDLIESRVRKALGMGR